MPSPTVASLPAAVKTSTEKLHLECKTDTWNDSDSSAETAVSDKANRLTIRPISEEDLPVKSTRKISDRSSRTMANAKEALYDSSLAFDYNPAVVAYVSSGKIQSTRTLRRRNMSSSSTIFKNSLLAPITIIVTTPEEQIPSPPPTSDSSYPQNPFNQIRAHRQSTSLPGSQRTSLSSPNSQFLIPNHNFLMPPTEQQISASKLRKAKEFREIRKFLITFMNIKGDQFPKKLRIKMMEMYCITEADLSPETVAKFNDSEIRDEGVALEQLGISEESTDADDLRMLRMMFTSQIPVVTPTREQAAVNTIPLPRARKQSLGARRAESRNEDGSFDWLSPLITTTPMMAPPLDSPPPRPEHKLSHSSSMPNMKPIQENDTPVPSIPASYSNALAQSKRGRNSTLSEGTTTSPVPIETKLKVLDQQTRVKRGNIVSAAFGSIREAISASKASKAAEKRRLLKDAIL